MFRQKDKEEVKQINGTLLTPTSAGVRQLSAPQEAQVTGPGPDRLRVPEAQLGVKVVGVQRLLPIDRVVP